jgi:alpha-galactosidase
MCAGSAWNSGCGSNPDSELFRRHPDWILSVPGIPPVTQRSQFVLDLGRQEVFDYLLDALDRLLAENAIGYLKWDMNRDLTTAGHDGHASVDRQTRALYRLLDRLRARHPAVEIESCSSGGGRADLGILRRTDRIWASDCNDAIERVAIHRGFGLYLPPEIMGAHVGPVHSHTTGRHLGIAFQASVALFGHFGLELDATAINDDDCQTLRRWIDRYKRFRPLLHDGLTRMLPADDPGLDVRAVVSRDGGEALVLCARLHTSEHQLPPPQRIPGLDANERFEVTMLELAGEANGSAGTTPFLSGTPVILSGTALACVGIRLPALSPASSVLIHLRRVAV